MLKLIGSVTSPFVRRTRLVLAQQQREYEFVNINILGDADREALAQYTPAMKIPVLVDGDQAIYDSRVIERYLSKNAPSPRDWSEENLLTLIDAVNDSMVPLFMLKRSGIEDQSLLICKLQQQRIDQTLTVLAQEAKLGRFELWNYPTICLLSLVEWAQMRELESFEHYPSILEAVETHQQQRGVEETKPPAV